MSVFGTRPSPLARARVKGAMMIRLGSSREPSFIGVKRTDMGKPHFMEEMDGIEPPVLTALQADPFPLGHISSELNATFSDTFNQRYR
jgi:hypothetical protein